MNKLLENFVNFEEFRSNFVFLYREVLNLRFFCTSAYRGYHEPSTEIAVVRAPPMRDSDSCQLRIIALQYMTHTAIR